MAFEMVDVDSSQIAQVGYDPETNKARVVFTNSAVYEYDDVEPEVVEEIAHSASPGRAFAGTLKQGYAYARIS